LRGILSLIPRSGNSYAEYQLGKIYRFGQGVPQKLEVRAEKKQALFLCSCGQEYDYSEEQIMKTLPLDSIRKYCPAVGNKTMKTSKIPTKFFGRFRDWLFTNQYGNVCATTSARRRSICEQPSATRHLASRKGRDTIAKRSDNGEGNVRTQKDGRWEGRTTSPLTFPWTPMPISPPRCQKKPPRPWEIF
jgi:hypothetical protein